MISPALLQRLESLPEPLQVEVAHYAEFLLAKYVETGMIEPVNPKKRKAGLLEGKIQMADDFDAPLEELQDYM